MTNISKTTIYFIIYMYLCVYREDIYIYVYMYICICICIYVCICIYICICICIFMCILYTICICISIYVCMYKYLYILNCKLSLDLQNYVRPSVLPSVLRPSVRPSVPLYLLQFLSDSFNIAHRASLQCRGRHG